MRYNPHAVDHTKAIETYRFLERNPSLLERRYGTGKFERIVVTNDPDDGENAGIIGFPFALLIDSGVDPEGRPTFHALSKGQTGDLRTWWVPEYVSYAPPVAPNLFRTRRKLCL